MGQRNIKKKKTQQHKQCFFLFIKIHQKHLPFLKRLMAISGSEQKYICCLMNNSDFHSNEHENTN